MLQKKIFCFMTHPRKTTPSNTLSFERVRTEQSDEPNKTTSRTKRRTEQSDEPNNATTRKMRRANKPTSRRYRRTEQSDEPNKATNRTAPTRLGRAAAALLVFQKSRSGGYSLSQNGSKMGPKRYRATNYLNEWFFGGTS